MKLDRHILWGLSGLALLFSFALLLLMAPKADATHAANAYAQPWECSRSYGWPVGPQGYGTNPTQYWNDPNFYYIVREFKLEAWNVNAEDGSILDSSNCADGRPTGNTVTTAGQISWGGIRPTDAILGVPVEWNGGSWASGICTAQVPDDPHQRQCDFGGTRTGFIDDGSQAFVNGTQIFCHNVNLGGGAPCQDALPSPLYNFDGAGSLFFGDPGAFTAGPSGLIGSDPGGLTDFDVRFFIENTKAGGYVGSFVMTFRYPKPPPPPVTISGQVTDVYGNPMPVVIDTCNGDIGTDPATGIYSFTVPYGTAYCLRIQPWSIPGSHNPVPRVDPNFEDYAGCAWWAGPCAFGTYEAQGAGYDAMNGLDRVRDDGFDFRVYPYINITGRVWDRDTTVGINGVVIDTCIGGVSATSGNAGPNGEYSFQVTYGDGFCAQANGGGIPATYESTPRIFPWDEAYRTCPANTVCGVNDYGFNTYDWQVAGAGVGGWDRTNDYGYEFALVFKHKPTGGVGPAACNAALTGTTSDVDYPSSQIRVRLWVDGPPGAGINEGFYPTDGAHNFSIDLTPFSDYGVRSFYVEAMGVDSSGIEDGTNETLATPSSAGPCAPPTCGSMQTYNDDPPEPAVPFGVRVNFVYTPGGRGRPISTAYGHIMRLTVGGTPYNVSPQSYIPYDPVPSWPAGAGTADTGPPSLVIAAPGLYTVSMTLSGVNLAPNPCTWTLTVASRPYFRVFNGDVVAGSGTCAAWFPDTAGSPGRILAFTNTIAGPGSGAGTQLLAQAMDVINRFSSAQSRPPGPGGPDTALTFANSPAGPYSYGGSFGVAGGNCPPDFWSQSVGLTPSPSPAILDINPSMTGRRLYQPGGNLNMKSAPKIQNGQVLTLYVDGDVTITEDIVNNSYTWANPNEIPSLVIIAHGNIYIDWDVSAIDAVLIAQPTSAAAGGNIYTCSIGNFLPSQGDMASDPAGACRQNKLTITGAVIARTIKLFRSNGSVNEALNADCAILAPRFGCTVSTAAEQFIYSPELWIRGNGTPSGPQLGKYDAITSLPPVL